MNKWTNIAFVFAFGPGVLFCAPVRADIVPADGERKDTAPVRLEDLRKDDVEKPATQPATQPAKPVIKKPRPAGATNSKSSAKADRRDDFNITEEEITRRLREEQTVPVTPPRGWQPRRVQIKSLPPEGTRVINHLCRIAREKNSDWLVATFVNTRHQPWQAPRRLLPCRLLERIEDILAKDPNRRFRISGETTIDLKHAYLLLQQASEVDDDKPPKPRTVREEKPAAGKAKASNSAVRPADQESTTDLRKALLEDAPGRAVRVALAPERTKSENVNSIAPAGKTPFSHGKKNLVVDRIVRIVKCRDGKGWEAHFQSDNTLREPPLLIHPNMMLVRAQTLRRTMGLADLELRVSGQITYYRGKRFLLLRKLLRQRNMGQF